MTPSALPFHPWAVEREGSVVVNFACRDASSRADGEAETARTAMIDSIAEAFGAIARIARAGGFAPRATRSHWLVRAPVVRLAAGGFEVTLELVDVEDAPARVAWLLAHVVRTAAARHGYDADVTIRARWFSDARFGFAAPVGKPSDVPFELELRVDDPRVCIEVLLRNEYPTETLYKVVGLWEDWIKVVDAGAFGADPKDTRALVIIAESPRVLPDEIVFFLERFRGGEEGLHVFANLLVWVNSHLAAVESVSMS